MTETRNTRRTLQGTVTSTKGSKTITVLVTRTFKHAKYGKYMRRQKKYHAHDEREEAGDGDVVEIAATRPISKLKCWRLVRVLEAAPERGLDVDAIAQAATEAAGAGSRKAMKAATEGVLQAPAGAKDGGS
jgi:small subunit ribosomal protein S17